MTWKKYTDPVLESEIYIPNVLHTYYTGTTPILHRYHTGIIIWNGETFYLDIGTLYIMFLWTATRMGLQPTATLPIYIFTEK